MKPKIWFTRKFPLIHHAEAFPNLLERLKGTPIRLEEKIQLIPKSLFTIQANKQWSIQEQVGHLLDLEPLWFARVEDFRNSRPILREADLTNQKTYDANHNAHSMENLLAAFRKERTKIMENLEALEERELNKSTLHPRLKTPMKIVDLCFFIAEHDDHHLAMITWLWNQHQN